MANELMIASPRLPAARDGKLGENAKLADVEVPSYGAAQPLPQRKSLPDLTERLKEQGVYSEYLQYRQTYLEWRMGAAKNAPGELTCDTLAEVGTEDPYEFEYPYHAVSKAIFEWRFTTAYWVAVSFMIGSFLFALTSGIALAAHGKGGHWMQHGPNSVGAFVYTVGTYFGYRQLINIGTSKEERHLFLTFNWNEITSRCPPSSIIGTMSYFIGALLCNIDAFANLWPLFGLPLSNFAMAPIFGWPTFFGCVLFVVGSICEIQHNKIFAKGGASLQEPVFWASLADAFGSLCFSLGAIPRLPSESFAEINWFLGSLFFVISSVLSLVMWEANDFGLTLLKQLNRRKKIRSSTFAVSTAGTTRKKIDVRYLDDPEVMETKGKMSARDIVFIIIYCWLASVTITNCVVKHLWFWHGEGRYIVELEIDMSLEIFVLCVVFLVLLIHSVVIHLPDVEPYRCALLLTRAIMTFGALAQTTGLAAFLHHPDLPRQEKLVEGESSWR